MLSERLQQVLGYVSFQYHKQQELWLFFLHSLRTQVTEWAADLDREDQYKAFIGEMPYVALRAISTIALESSTRVVFRPRLRQKLHILSCFLNLLLSGPISTDYFYPINFTKITELIFIYLLI